MSKGFLVPGHDPFLIEHMAYNIRMTQTDDVGLAVMLPKGARMEKWVQELVSEVVRYEPTETHSDDCTVIYTYDCSPFDKTIVLSPDMLFPNDFSHWWDLLSGIDYICSTAPFTFRGDPIEGDPNRAAFKQNRLPDVYTNLMYFERSKQTEQMFDLAKQIAEHWVPYRYDRLQGSIGMKPKNDTVVSCAIKEIGQADQLLNRDFSWFGFTNMVMQMQGVPNPEDVQDDWIGQIPAYIRSDGSVVIGQHLQTRPIRFYNGALFNSTNSRVMRNGYDKED